MVNVAWLVWRPVPRPTPRQELPTVSRAPYQGVASCAASACHGRPDPASHGGEWSTWSRRDPHARAYDVLLQDRSRQIEQRLNPDRGEPHPEKDDVCLNCHVEPGIAQAERSPRFAFADGVGCESCHGPSGNWLHEHGRPGWTQAKKGEPPTGMKDLRDFRVRAEVCTSCHIGKDDIAVTHDLIAAGHPRLRFEFAAYLANYPPHWPTDRDRQKYPDLDATAWLVGQTVSAEASLQLLSHRARSRNGTWPELTDFDCFACHHDLVAGSWRQQDRTPHSHLGTLALNEWYYAALPAVVDDFTIESLAESMSSPNPNRDHVIARIAPLISLLQKRKEEFKPTRLDPPARFALLARLAEIERLPGRPGWDRDTQLYLGAMALAASHPNEPPELSRAVTALQSPLHQAFQGDKGEWLASPRRYDPNVVRECWQEIRKQLR